MISIYTIEYWELKQHAPITNITRASPRTSFRKIYEFIDLFKIKKIIKIPLFSVKYISFSFVQFSFDGLFL